MSDVALVEILKTPGSSLDFRKEGTYRGPYVHYSTFLVQIRILKTLGSST